MSVFVPTIRHDAERVHARARTLSPSVAAGTRAHPRVVATQSARPSFRARAAFEVRAGQIMEYELMLPAGHNPVVPVPFVVSVSGAGQQHINGFSQRLASENWAVVVPVRPEGAPLMFEGKGCEGDGVWYLHRLCLHLLDRFAVDSGRFLLAGVSNGGMSILRFATLWPELCRGLIVATGHLKGIASDNDLKRLQGLPIDMYVGAQDEVGMLQPMQELESKLRGSGQHPLPDLTVFPGAGHCCSPLIDTRVLFGKIRLMLFNSARNANRLPVQIEPPCDALSRLPTETVHAQLASFSAKLGLQELQEGGIVVCVKSQVIASYARARAVTFSDVQPFRTLSPIPREQVCFTEEGAKANSPDARVSRTDSGRPRLVRFGDDVEVDAHMQVAKRARGQRGVCVADDGNRAESGVHASIVKEQTTISHRGSPQPQSPRAVPAWHVSPDASSLALRPRCQTARGPSLAETHERMRLEQQRRKSVPCGAEVACRNVRIPEYTKVELIR